jgi:hypothetical protein
MLIAMVSLLVVVVKASHCCCFVCYRWRSLLVVFANGADLWVESLGQLLWQARRLRARGRRATIGRERRY